MKIPTIACTYKGKRCTAIAKDKSKWVMDVHSEAEAELMCEAVVDRGYVKDEFWRKQ